MKMNLKIDQWGGVRKWEDALGAVPAADFTTEDMSVPAFRLIRHDDAWRPLGDANATDLLPCFTDGRSEVEFTGIYGGERSYAHGSNPRHRFPNHWPAAFDVWPYAGDIHPHHPMRFSGRLAAEPVTALDATGVKFTVTIQDLRDPSNPGPQGTIRMPVGIELPLPRQGGCYGSKEFFFTDYAPLDHGLDDPDLRRAWYYLEGDLFGLRAPRPSAESPLRGVVEDDAWHIGSPLAAFSEDSKTWWAVASEADYGAAVLWGRHRMRYFSTLYLRPGGEASWSWVVWRNECREPSRLLLQCTREGGFFDRLNPRSFKPAGPPPGPVLFANVSRLQFQMEQIEALRPGLVLLNYHYDHVSSVGNLYGEWTTYEGFRYSEEKLKDLIASLRKAGVARVGVYGTQIEQPESHRPVRQGDIVLDPWGRRYHAWEPGNWVVDGGNTDCGERLARAEAEFCRHYGFDAVFVDRQDYMGVNANPQRVGKSGDQRMECIPSIRLGMIELNRQRMDWQRRLNPGLLVGLNNTTGWAGVRYSDWNHLEGGNTGNREIPILLQPAGVVDKRHTTPLFGAPYAGFDFFKDIEAELSAGFGNSAAVGFLDIMRRFIGESLLGGAEASPYGDESFVDPESMLFNGSNSKLDPDEQKLAKIRSQSWAGGTEWRSMREAVLPALAAARSLTTPPARVATLPDEGVLPTDCQFHARAGDSGGIFVAFRNNGTAEVSVQLGFNGFEFGGAIPAEAVRVWWASSPGDAVASLTHQMA